MTIPAAIVHLIIAMLVSTGASVDMATYWPGSAAGTYYLDGTNRGQPTTVFVEFGPDGTFRQYNSSPYNVDAHCAFDTLAWRDGFLRYISTTNVCAHTEITYDPPLALLPRESGDWQSSQRADATFRLDGEIRCRGTIYIDASLSGMHARNTQRTDWTWTKGSMAGCPAGNTTLWEEDYWFGDLPMPGGGTSPAVTRTTGGNVNGAFSWDVTYSRWLKR